MLVNKYYDVESKRSFTPIHYGMAVGTQYLGTEADYIIKDNIKDFYFGHGIEEADLAALYQFKFTYGNGDYYTGAVYASQDYGYFKGWKQQTVDENRLTGLYEITGMSYIEDPSKYGQVNLTRYYDAESRKFQQIVSYTGNNYLTSESGYIKTTASASYFFGYGYYEADIK